MVCKSASEIRMLSFRFFIGLSPYFKVGPGFCPVISASGDQPVAMLASPKRREITLSGDDRIFSENAPVEAYITALGLLLQKKKILRHRGNTALTVANIPDCCILFRKCIFSYKPRKARHGNDFSDCISVPQKRQNSIVVTLPLLLCDRSVYGIIRTAQPLLPPCYTCDTFLSEGSIPDAFCLFPAQKDHSLLLGSHTQGTGILLGAGFYQPFLC